MDRVWADPKTASFGGLEAESLSQFSSQMASNVGFRNERKNDLLELFNQRDTDETGILKGEQGLAFIDEALAAMTGQ